MENVVEMILYEKSILYIVTFKFLRIIHISLCKIPMPNVATPTPDHDHDFDKHDLYCVFSYVK